MILIVMLLLPHIPAYSLPADVYQAEASGLLDPRKTAYSIPSSKVYFVSPAGSDVNTGSSNAPFRTLAKAISAASSGFTIVLRAGRYREGGFETSANLTIQPYPHEQVWLDGTELVNGFVDDGHGRWRKDAWTHLFEDSSGRPVGSTIDPRWLDSSYPLAGWPDAVWVDGTEQQQVGELGELRPGTFYVDYANGRLYLGADPAGRMVEAAVRTYAFNLEGGRGFTLLGLGFTRYASHHVEPHLAMVRSNEPHVLLENNTFVHGSYDGVRIYGDDNVVRGNTFYQNGKTGLAAFRADRLLVEHNELVENNRQRFAGWDAAGAKMVRVHDGIVRDNLADGNHATGLWCDISCNGTIFSRNTVRSNHGSGIESELSARTIIVSNVAYANRYGIYIIQTNDGQVWNNTMHRNNVNVVVAENHHIAHRSDLDESITWDQTGLVMANNIMSDSDAGPFIMRAIDWSNSRPASGFFKYLDYNSYHRADVLSPNVLIQFQGSRSNRESYDSLSSFRNSYPQYEANGQAGDGVPDPFFVDASSENFQLKREAPVRADGTHPGQPLPQLIADAVNSGLAVPIVQAGVVVDRGALHLGAASGGQLRRRDGGKTIKARPEADAGD